MIVVVTTSINNNNAHVTWPINDDRRFSSSASSSLFWLVTFANCSSFISHDQCHITDYLHLTLAAIICWLSNRSCALDCCMLSTVLLHSSLCLVSWLILPVEAGDDGVTKHRHWPCKDSFISLSCCSRSRPESSCLANSCFAANNIYSNFCFSASHCSRQARNLAISLCKPLV